MSFQLRYRQLPTTLIGEVRIVVGKGGLAAIQLGADLSSPPDPTWLHAPDPECPVTRQLTEYLNRERRRFDLSPIMAGTQFQLRVWRALTGIPYGETVTYGELAARIGNPRAVRAVGTACGRNRIPIVIPCHRVIGASGRLTGYAGGLEIKRALLKLEGTLPID
jgi:methylated-DNA-[protein]-cysteine S-methyltransferase